jgi:hypothetical protein
MGFCRNFALGLVLAIGASCFFFAFLMDFQVVQCPDPAAANCPDRFFSLGYFEARQKFRTAVAAIEGQHSSHAVHQDAVTGLEYTIDVGVVKGGLSDSVLVHMSGVHGPEGYAGSAIQLALLEQIRNGTLKKAKLPTLVFVHAVNPTGMAAYRRFNHRNVDLNRNWFEEEDWPKALNRDPNFVGYQDLEPILNPKVPPTVWNVIIHFLSSLPPLFSKGFLALKTAIVTGQYHNPQGVYYGGIETQINYKILREIVAPFSKYSKVVIIDVHTGLGPTGKDTLLIDRRSDYKKAMKLFGNSDVASIDCSVCGNSGDVGAGYEHMMGGLHLGSVFTNGDTFEVCQEFGTRPGIIVFLSTAWENAAYQLCPNTFLHERAARWSRDAFYVPTLAWKTEIVSRGTRRFAESLQHFAH